MQIVQVKYRAGNLAMGKEGFETDRERAVLPALVYAGQRSGQRPNNHLWLRLVEMGRKINNSLEV